MILAAWSTTPPTLHAVRNLTEAELEESNKYTPIYSEAKRRLQLFRVLALNYQEWLDYLKLLLRPETTDHDEIELRLNQRLFNFLTNAYTIHEHFETSYRRRFRKDAKKLEAHKKHESNLESTYWSYAFFSDFRNYVQHCDMPVGSFSRHVAPNRVEVQVIQDAARLVKDDPRGWKRSRLNIGAGSLNLVDLLSEYYIILVQEYGSFVATTFFPELFQASEFYTQLTKEAVSTRPGFRMVFVDTPQIRKTNPGRLDTDLNITIVPNDVFAELGIRRRDH